MRRSAVWLVLLALLGCPKRRQPEHGVELRFSKKGDVRQAVERRLAALEVRARLTDDDEALVVRVPDVAPGDGVSTLKAVLTRAAHLELCAEARGQGERLCSADAGVEVRAPDQPETDCALVGPSEQALVALARPLTPGRVLGGPLEPGSGLSRTFVSEADCQTPRVLEATAKADPTSGAPHLELTFDAPSTSAFADLTGRLRGRRLLVVLDEQVQTAPVVREAITQGRTWLTFGNRVTLEEARQLAVALEGGPIAGGLRLISEARYGPPTLLTR